MQGANAYGYRVWSRADIEGVVLALASSHQGVAGAVDTPEMRLYSQGYMAALQAFGSMFGISVPSTPSPMQEFLETLA